MTDSPRRTRRWLVALFVVFLSSTALLLLAPRERVVFEQRSEFQEIVVSERGDVRTLRFGRDGAVQSRVRVGRPEDLVVPYVRASLIGLAFAPDPQRILIVGLGGGSLPSYLRLAYPGSSVDVAELDPVVAQTAKEWFGLVEDELLRVHIGDGRAFIEARSRHGSSPYDLIVLDAYGSSSVPKALTTREFLSSVREALAEEGVVVANVWGPPSNPRFDAMMATYQDVFDELFVFPVPRRSNRVVVALPFAGGAPDDLTGRLDRLSARLPGGQALGSLLRAGDPRVTEWDYDAEVLVD